MGEPHKAGVDTMERTLIRQFLTLTLAERLRVIVGSVRNAAKRGEDSPHMNAFNPVAAVRALQRNHVRFVVVGSFAARIYGSEHLIAVLEICTDDAAANREALAAARAELNAVVWSEEDGVYGTNAGPLAVRSCPGAEYRELARNATTYDLADDVRVAIASIDDLLRMKRAAGRPKDLIEVEILSALKEEREKMPGVE